MATERPELLENDDRAVSGGVYRVCFENRFKHRNKQRPSLPLPPVLVDRSIAVSHEALLATAMSWNVRPMGASRKFPNNPFFFLSRSYVKEMNQDNYNQTVLSSTRRLASSG